MHSSIYNAKKVCVGHLALIDGAIVAFDVNNHELGRFNNSLEAASAVLRHARQPAPTEYDEQMLFEAITAHMKAGA